MTSDVGLGLAYVYFQESLIMRFGRSIWICSAILAMASFAFASMPQDSQSAKQDTRNAGQTAKNGAQSTGHAAKKGAKKTGQAAKKTTNKGAHKTQQGAKKVQKKTQPNSQPQ
jgi:hypothetical protein